MKPLKPINLIFTLMVAGSLLFCIIPTAHGFYTFDVLQVKSALMHRIDEPQWTIGLRYGSDCPPEERKNKKALEQATTTALQAWLQPLRDLRPARPITNAFRYRWQPDFREGEEDEDALDEVDMRITFLCRFWASNALVVGWKKPDVFIRRGTEVNPILISVLTHELGHAFGLSDTYTRGGKKSSGGLEQTVGKQPSSLMASFRFYYPPLSEDDKRGIIWIYKHVYEGLPIDDCFFPDYVPEDRSPISIGCRPKHPLIFEAKYSPSDIVLQILDEDPSIDINTQDDSGRTALHYAVIRGDTLLFRGSPVGRTISFDGLLSYKDLDVNIRDADGRTAIEEALKRGHSEIVTLLLTVPDIRRPLGGDGDTLTTTWGALKLER